METTGRVIQVCDVHRGLSAGTGKPWATRGFVIETHEQYPRKQYIELFGEERINTLTPAVGEDVTVSIDIESREWSGRWFTSVRAWKVEKTTAAAAAQPLAAQPMPSAAPAPAAPAAPAQAPQGNSMGDNTGLPF